MEKPVTGSLDPYTWDSEEAVAYEAAIEAINGVVGAYSALMHAEEQRPEQDRDADRVAEWRRLRAQCQQERQRLDPTDTEQVAGVRRQYAERLRDLSRRG